MSTSFTRLPPPPPAPSSPPPPISSPPSETAPTAQDAGSARSSEDEAWKEEYERYLAEWRAEADAARAKAERTRAEWERRRREEEEEERRLELEERDRRAKEQKEKESLAGWETVSPADDSGARQPLPDSSVEDIPPVPGASLGGGVGISDEKSSEARLDAAQSAASQNERKYGREPEKPASSPADTRDLVTGEDELHPGDGLEVMWLLCILVFILTGLA